MQLSESSDTGRRVRLAEWTVFLPAWFPRSGGRWLSESLFHVHPDISMHTLSSPFFQLSAYDLINLVKRTCGALQHESLAEWVHDFELLEDSSLYACQAGVRRYLERSAESWSQKPATGVAGLSIASIETTPKETISVLRSLMPELKLLHLVRHPLRCYDGHLGTEGLHDPFEFSVAWRRWNATLRLAMGNHDHNYLSVSYNSLVKEPRAVLARICAWLGITEPAGHAANALTEWNDSHVAGPDGTAGLVNVTPEQLDIVAELAGEEAAHYGFDPRAADQML